MHGDAVRIVAIPRISKCSDALFNGSGIGVPVRRHLCPGSCGGKSEKKENRERGNPST
jgi:hypothetical protein